MKSFEEEEKESEFSSSNSDKEEESEVKEQHKKTQEEMSHRKKESHSNYSYNPESQSKTSSEVDKKLEDIIKLVNSMGFTQNEKNEIVVMLRNKDRAAIELFEESQRKKNLM